jgi:hypothetical protein
LVQSSYIKAAKAEEISLLLITQHNISVIHGIKCDVPMFDERIGFQAINTCGCWKVK